MYHHRVAAIEIFLPQTDSNRASEETTRPQFSHSIHRILNSSGVSSTGLPNSVQVVLVVDIQPVLFKNTGGERIVVALIAAHLRFDAPLAP